ncbi:hypothetical protein V8B55DRAFT_1444929 [Mucor lusitanicus]|uniref:SAP domain-containing protein n=1 Tax=Mucor lusitanicus CBS 277.49 TaxID=747725 RepID=A0A168H3L3_MUCCL|nr:hypothetical protein MUCCIDRAFT_167426 [Mucor lusitanicus CBS 277.49]
MEDANDYFKLDYPPFFTNIDWNENASTNNTFIPMEFDQQKIPPSYQHQPFQRRRSSSVDLPINPLYSNTNRYMMGSNETTIHEEEPQLHPAIKVGSSATLEFPASSNSFNFNNLFVNANADGSPSLSTCSSTNNDENMISPPLSQAPLAPHPQQPLLPQQTQKKASPPPPPPSQASQQQTITFFPELHRTSYNTILGKQLKQHQKRRRSSSLPPAFHSSKTTKPTPLIFTQIQVTDPTPIHHTQKAAKVDTRPIAIERVPKKEKVVAPVISDPVEKQRKLDDQLIKLNFEDVTVAELKEMLRERGLSSSGKKAVLTDRLREARDVLLGIQPKKPAVVSASPAIQGMADMTIHSPCPPTMMFSPMQDTTIHPSEAHYQYQPSSTNAEQPVNDLDINDLFDFDTMLDGNAILFPPSTAGSSQAQQQQQQQHTNQWESDWDQDKLDHFLTELV